VIRRRKYVECIGTQQGLCSLNSMEKEEGTDPFRCHLFVAKSTRRSRENITPKFRNKHGHFIMQNLIYLL